MPDLGLLFRFCVELCGISVVCVSGLGTGIGQPPAQLTVCTYSSHTPAVTHLLSHNCCCCCCVVQVYKEEGRAFAMLAFASPTDRSSFVSGFRAGQQNPNAANSEMLLLLPGQAVPEEAVAAMNGNNKRKHGAEQPPRKVGVCV